ncbi:MAG: aminotransferase class IV [Bdellovibrionota bacterium]
MQIAILNLNGQLSAPEKAQVSAFDRSYLYGDSLYEVVRTYGGQFFLLEEHLARLQKSAALCRMRLAQSSDDYRREILRTYEAFTKLPGQAGRDAYMRIVVSRGVGKIGFGLKDLSPTQFTIYVQPVDPVSTELFEKGYCLQISPRLRNHPQALDPAMKSGNYLNSLLAYLEATENGYNDALLCNADGHLTEGTTFNIFYVRRGIIATPPLDIGILDGITRREVLAVAAQLGIEAREVRFPRERLWEADEVFLSSSVREVLPVTQVDGRKIAGGKPGPLTRKLAAEYRRIIESRAARNRKAS